MKWVVIALVVLLVYALGGGKVIATAVWEVAISGLVLSVMAVLAGRSGLARKWAAYGIAAALTASVGVYLVLIYLQMQIHQVAH